jgi:hypothetical protein
MRANPRPFHHARILILGVGGLAVLWTGIFVTRGLESEPAAIFAALAGTVVLLLTSWIGWIDLTSVLSLGIDEKALSVGWPTRRVIPWKDVTSVRRSIGTLRLVVKTRGATERIQLLVLRSPPAALAQLVRAAQTGGGKVEEYLTKLAEYVEDTADRDD